MNEIYELLKKEHQILFELNNLNNKIIAEQKNVIELQKNIINKLKERIGL